MRGVARKKERVVVSLDLMHRKKTILLAFLICVGEGGCDLEWSKPDPSVPPPQRFVEAKPRSAPAVPSGADFAALFGSEEMRQLVAGALQDNLDIAAAVARITEADAQARVSSAALWPNVSFGGSAQRSQTPTGTVTFADIDPFVALIGTTCR